MNCPHCASTTTKEQAQKTTLGYRIFRCSACKHLFNERTGTPFNAPGISYRCGSSGCPVAHELRNEVVATST